MFKSKNFGQVCTLHWTEPLPKVFPHGHVYCFLSFLPSQTFLQLLTLTYLESTIDLSKNDGLALWVILESLFLIKYYLMCCLLNKKRYNLLELRRFVICKMLVKEKY